MPLLALGVLVCRAAAARDTKYCGLRQMRPCSSAETGAIRSRQQSIMAPPFRDTKTYDVLVASPLIVFYLFAAAGIVIQTWPEIGNLARHFDWPRALDATSQILGMAF